MIKCRVTQKGLEHLEESSYQTSYYQVIVSLSDCVVEFDLRECPPTVKVQDYSEHFLELVKSFEQTRSKENITCGYCSYIFDGELDEDGDTPSLIMQRMFPHEWLTNGRRSDAHNNG